MQSVVTAEIEPGPVGVVAGASDGATVWARARPPGAPARGASRVYELFVLGHLIDWPLHGYAFIASSALGPFPQFNSATLYPLVQRLQDDSLIEAVAPEAADRGRPRKVYRLTERGRQRFL